MSLFNKSTVKNFTKERYMSIVRSHPKLTEEKAQMYIMLFLTFLSLSFLGIFAINPTLTTIAELKRKLEDSEFINESLTKKVSNLSSLNTQYDNLSGVWSIVSDAVPNNPQAVKLLGQIQSIANESGVSITDLQSATVEISKVSRKKPIPKQSSFEFTVSAEGQKENLASFVNIMANFNRLVAIEEINYTNIENEAVTIKGRVFFTI